MHCKLLGFNARMHAVGTQCAGHDCHHLHRLDRKKQASARSAPAVCGHWELRIDFVVRVEPLIFRRLVRNLDFLRLWCRFALPHHQRAMRPHPHSTFTPYEMRITCQTAILSVPGRMQDSGGPSVSRSSPHCRSTRRVQLS